MEEKESGAISWTLLFIVTGISFWGFGIILRLLDASHITVFNRIGAVAILLGILTYLNQWLGKRLFTGKSKLADPE